MQRLETALQHTGSALDFFRCIPLVIGITGHRHILASFETRLAEKFESILDELRATCPSTPLLVLSELAAGADILAAEVAIERGVPVVAVVPDQLSSYEIDFTPEERERFHCVLRRCYDQISVRARSTDANKYVAAGEYIARYANALVAFWDGVAANSPGGTSDIVRLRLSGLSPAEPTALHADPDLGVVYQIVTPRTGAPRPHNCFSVVKHYPRTYGNNETAERTFKAALANLNQFNEDFCAAKHLHKDRGLNGIQECASAMANRYQRFSVSAQFVIYAVAITTGLSQVIWSEAALRFTIPILAVTLCIFVFAKRTRLERRYQDYRALSEALRVQYAWCCGGLSEPDVTQLYLRHQRSELKWISMAIRSAFLTMGGRETIAGCGPTHEVCSSWINSQRLYYRKAGRRQQQFKKWLDFLEAALTIAAVCCAAIAITIPDQHVAQKTMEYFAYCGAVALLMRYIAQQYGFSENARRYENMYVAFQDASNVLHAKLRTEAADLQVLEEIGKAALAEHASWLVLRRERPLTFIHV